MADWKQQIKQEDPQDSVAHLNVSGICALFYS